MQVGSSPSDYAVARERRRRNGRVVGLVLLVGFGASAILKAGYVAALVLAGFLAALVIAIAGIRIRAIRRGDISTDPSSSAVFPAQLPVFVARSAGQQARPNLGETAELTGTICISPPTIQWLPSPRSVRLGFDPISWDKSMLTKVGVFPSRGAVPMSLVELRANGLVGEIWVRRPAGLVLDRLADFDIHPR